MKKLFLIAAIFMFGTASAQTGFKVGAHAGLPVGDVSDFNSFVLGADAAYLIPIYEEFSAGIATGYHHFFPKKDFEGGGIVPVAATVQYLLAPTFSIGGELGYGFFTKGGSGGAYYQPKIAYHFGGSEVNLGYMGVSRKGFTTSAINLGLAFSLGQ